MTPVEGERLAVLETQMASAVSDIAEIKADVKELVRVQALQQVTLAAERAADVAQAKSRSDLGIWVRATIPWLIAFFSLGLGLINLIRS